jgi:hypothetical protein
MFKTSSKIVQLCGWLGANPIKLLQLRKTLPEVFKAL